MNYKFDGSKVFFTSDTHFLYRKMEGFAGFVGLMFGLVVLSVIITLVVCAVKRHRREWLQDGQRRV